MTTQTQAAVAPARGEKTELVGKVTSAKMEKTIVVEVQRLVQHEHVERARARLLLDQGKDDEADAALGRVDRLLRDSEEYRLLQSRLDVRRGDYDKAFQRLRKGLKSNDLASSEGYALLAISARATGHKEELDKALKKARENGAEVPLRPIRSQAATVHPPTDTATPSRGHLSEG